MGLINMPGRFHRGQTVYYGCNRISEKGVFPYKETLCMVISRTIDTCGKKQITFKDYGSDFAFGRKELSGNPAYFNTPEEAFKYIEDNNYYNGRKRTIITDKVFSDENEEWFEYSKLWSAN